MTIEENSLTLNMTGMDDVKKAFQAFPALLQGKIALVALRQGANYLAKEIRADAPVSAQGSREKDLAGRGNAIKYPPGRLRKAIVVKKSKIKTIKRTGVVGMYITVNQGKKRNDPKGAWYGRFVEGGHATKKGRYKTSRNRQGSTAGSGKVQGRFFIKKTFDAKAQKTAQIIANAAEIAMVEALHNLGLAVTGH